MKSTVYSLAALLPLVLPTQANDLWAQVSCFTSTGNMENMGSYEFQSVGHCTTECEKVNGVFAAVQEELCYCGTAALDIQDMALADDESACNATCPGYAVDTCGGDGVYSLWVSQAYALSLNDDDDESGSDSYSDWNNTSTAVAITNASASSTTAINAVSTSPSVSGPTSSTTAAASQTATGSAAITTTTSTSGASRRFRILFF
ncbi:uncharacterized protein BO95DRAFT_512207 [Aspergillus brunneoviolaceus CBS 621.78]|uniref:Uncharacterized protein n=1 Tax=Aspergillus brunneoviolaceus CBS 621.78 TaxID=1450534 RepID=A0ACD1GHU0_9EURO|nr:hypothetical protein BO95DRAFT_512207 [Aspergillus brunneoviolaceus CBS 621.78]RAH48730.1 hypothetical protein BO95DRAFT_512207 [Aspergillus brunneoviolaceus CBS 621.78]